MKIKGGYGFENFFLKLYKNLLRLGVFIEILEFLWIGIDRIDKYIKRLTWRYKGIGWNEEGV